MFLSHGLDEAEQVVPLGLLQLRHQGGQAVEATVDGLRLSGVDRRQHSQQHVVTCKKTQAEKGHRFNSQRPPVEEAEHKSSPKQTY